MDIDFEKVIHIIIDKIDAVEKEIGDEFLELMIHDIKLYDSKNKHIETLEGMDYDLNRSKHWDKNEKLIFHDGISEENLFDILEDFDYPEENTDIKIIVSCDGMTDLEEPVNFEFEVNIKYDK